MSEVRGILWLVGLACLSPVSIWTTHDETVRRQFATAMAQIETVTVADWPVQIVDSIQSISTLTTEICNSV